MVKLDPSDARSVVLQWYDIRRGKDSGGELLAAFELFLVSVILRAAFYTCTCYHPGLKVIKLCFETSVRVQSFHWIIFGQSEVRDCQVEF